MMTRRRAARAVTALAVVVAVAATTGCTFGQNSGPSPVASSGAVAGLPDAALEVMNQPQFADGRWLISVEDLDSGATVIDLDAGKMAEPGSFVKTYSAGAAWVKWGPDHTISTPVKRFGTTSNGLLTGDLVLVGQGDLTMGGRTKADGTVDFTNFDHNDANALPGATLTTEDPLAGLDQLAAEVKASGINAIDGDVVIDDRLFSGELVEEPITPIIINQNVLDILVTPGSAGEPASAALTPAVAPWKLDNRVQTGAAGSATSIPTPKVSPDDPHTLIITGSIAADSAPALKVHVLDDPATFARTAFIEALQRQGISVSSDPTVKNPDSALPDSATVAALPTVAQLTSLPLGQEVTYVMKISYNRGAQTLLCRLAADAGETDCDEGLTEAQKIWANAGLDTTGASLIDGSGLDGNFITPKNSVDIQTIFAKRPDASAWRDTLPILGVDGSLADVQKDSAAAGKVFAKTGTLIGGDAFNNRYRLVTKTLGGVMDTAKGRHFAFTIMVNQGFYSDTAGVFQANDDVGKVAAVIQQAY